MVPRSQQFLSAMASSLVLGATLAIVFVALFVATSGPWNELLRRSDAVLPMLALILNMSALFTGILFAAASGERAADADTGSRARCAPPRLRALAVTASPRRAADLPTKNV